MTILEISDDEFIAAQDEIRSRENQAWARWLARTFDVMLVVPIVVGLSIAIGAIFPTFAEAVFFPEKSSIAATAAAAAISIAVSLAVEIAIEPVFLALAGATPGKWIMGIRIRRHDGSRPGYWVAVARSGLVQTLGRGLTIPFVSFAAYIISRAKLISDGTTI